jgi:hypothetical protein
MRSGRRVLPWTIFGECACNDKADATKYDFPQEERGLRLCSISFAGSARQGAGRRLFLGTTDQLKAPFHPVVVCHVENSDALL